MENFNAEDITIKIKSSSEERLLEVIRNELLRGTKIVDYFDLPN